MRCSRGGCRLGKGHGGPCDWEGDPEDDKLMPCGCLLAALALLLVWLL